jgi:hypothetical protein
MATTANAAKDIGMSEHAAEPFGEPMPVTGNASSERVFRYSARDSTREDCPEQK